MPTTKKPTDAKKPAAKRKVSATPKPKAKPAAAAPVPDPKPASVKAPKPPRIPPFVNGDPTKEKFRLPLKPEDFLRKTHEMLEIARERTNIEAEYEAAKADFKFRIKDRTEQIVDIQGQLQSNSEEQEIAVYWRYFPKRKVKRKINAATGKIIGQTLPMTPDEVKRHLQADLLDVPPTPKPAATPAAVPAANGQDADGFKVVEFPPIEGTSKKLGKESATHQDHANVGAGGGDESDDIPDHLQE